MAAQDDVSNAEMGHGVFDRRFFAVGCGAGGGDEVAGVPEDEQLPRPSLRQEIWIDARIGAGDEKGQRRLPFAQLPKQLLLAAEDPLLKVEDSLNDSRHGSPFQKPGTGRLGKSVLYYH